MSHFAHFLSRPFIEEPTFEPDSISSVSTAAAALCSWCLNIIKLCGARCDVESKQLELAKANTALASSQQKLSVITAKINVSISTVYSHRRKNIDKNVHFKYCFVFSN